MQQWYSSANAARLKKRAALCKGSMILLGAAALAACIVLCTRVNTGNAARLLWWVAGLSTAAGWVVLLTMAFLYRPLKAQAGHVAGLLGGEEEQYTGRLSLLPGGFQIPGSIVVRKAKLMGEGEPLTLNVNARCVRDLPPQEALVRVTAVRTFITAAEVMGDERV